jgi:hypothetical protein
VFSTKSRWCSRFHDLGYIHQDLLAVLHLPRGFQRPRPTPGFRIQPASQICSLEPPLFLEEQVKRSWGLIRSKSEIQAVVPMSLEISGLIFDAWYGILSDTNVKNTVWDAYSESSIFTSGTVSPKA